MYIPDFQEFIDDLKEFLFGLFFWFEDGLWSLIFQFIFVMTPFVLLAGILYVLPTTATQAVAHWIYDVALTLQRHFPY